MAMMDFVAEQPDELGFVAGDVIHLLNRIDASWLEGELDGHVGIFPADFVEIITPLP